MKCDYRAHSAITGDRYIITERGYIPWSKRVERTDNGPKMGSSAIYIGWTHVGGDTRKGGLAWKHREGVSTN